MANPGAVEVGPGTLYWAPLGTTEPSSVSGAWPAGWLLVGYTDNGSEFSYNISTDQVQVEEELDPIRYATTGRAGSLTFAMAEDTAQNWLLALNTNAAASQTAVTGGVKIEPPALGAELRCMLGWDSANIGGITGDLSERLIIRQALQTGTITSAHRKGANKRLISVVFSFEKPTGATPFAILKPTALIT